MLASPSRWRSRVLAVLAGPLFAAGFVAVIVAQTLRWCRAAVLVGADSARERRTRAG